MSESVEFDARKLKEIGKLIELCRKSGVKTLKFANLEVEFNRDSVEPATQTVTPDVSGQEIIPFEGDDSSKPVSDDLYTYDEDKLLEEDYENLPLLDPEEFERLIGQGKLDEYGSPIAEA